MREETIKLYEKMIQTQLIDIANFKKQVEEKNEEIERLKEEYMILQNASDKVEEGKDREIERLNNDIKELLKENENKEKVIKAQDNIIKEVREYIKENMKIISKGQAEDTRLPVGTFMWNVDKVLEILDKEKE